jgi:RNA polymerase sigma factor (sigma-70 family)
MASPDPLSSLPGAAGPGEEPLEELLERIRPRIKKLLRKYGIPLQDAEDVVQDAILVALSKWDTIHYKEGWILSAVRFKCSNYWRRQRGDRLLGMEVTLLEELSEPQSPGQEQDEIQHDLRNVTRGLDPRQRAALWLRFGVGLDADEIARRLGYCASSIRKLTGRSLARLQKKWGTMAPDDDPSSS